MYESDVNWAGKKAQSRQWWYREVIEKEGVSGGGKNREVGKVQWGPYSKNGQTWGTKTQKGHAAGGGLVII